MVALLTRLLTMPLDASQSLTTVARRVNARKPPPPPVRMAQKTVAPPDALLARTCERGHMFQVMDVKQHKQNVLSMINSALVLNLEKINNFYQLIKDKAT